MLRTASRLVLVAGAVAAGAAGVMAMRADLMIGYAFSRAFGAYSGAPFQVAEERLEGRMVRTEVGDEAYWLWRGDAIARQVMLTGRPAVGQRIVYVSPEDGRTRYLEVVSIDFVSAPIVNVSVSDGPPMVRLMRVTFRVVDPYGSEMELAKDQLVHLWFQTEAKPTAARPLQPT